MTPHPIFQVDAFADKPFSGNQAAVMPLDHWLRDEVMQAIAAENNLSETAFTVPSERDPSAAGGPATTTSASNARRPLSMRRLMR